MAYIVSGVRSFDLGRQASDLVHRIFTEALKQKNPSIIGAPVSTLGKAFGVAGGIMRALTSVLLGSAS